jgi:ankyrin repeat protein
MMATEANRIGKLESWKADEALNILKELVRMPNIDLNAMANLWKHNTSTYKEASTALHYAVEHDLHEVVEVLLAGGADVNVQDEQGNTALMLAVKGNNLILATALMNHPGIDPNVQDEQGDTALMVAAHNDLDLATALMNHPRIDVNVQLHYAVEGNHMDLVAALMNHPGIDLNVQDEQGNTALHLAVYYNHPAIVSQLLTGKNINTSLMDVMNRTPLQVAIWSNYTECVNILQKHERHEHDRLLNKRSPEGSGGGGSSKPNITDRLLKKRSPEGEGGGGSSKRRNRNTTQSVIKLPFSKLKL